MYFVNYFAYKCNDKISYFKSKHLLNAYYVCFSEFINFYLKDFFIRVYLQYKILWNLNNAKVLKCAYILYIYIKCHIDSFIIMVIMIHQIHFWRIYKLSQKHSNLKIDIPKPLIYTFYKSQIVWCHLRLNRVCVQHFITPHTK